MSRLKPTEFAIIRTRLAPPRIGSAPVSREALLKRLDAGRHCKLNLVIGPAGSGKTMLLAQWRKLLKQQGAKVAWYNLGADDDVTQAGAYIVESLRSEQVEVRTEALQFFTRNGGKSPNTFLASLIDDLIDCSEEVYVVIDDAHYGTAKEIFGLLEAFLSAIPDNVHLVIGSRSRPPIDLARLRSHDQLAELDFGDLRFNRDETSRFVGAQGIAGLKPEHIERLYEMSDGWAAGLQLLVFALRKEKEIDHFFARHAGDSSISQESALASYLESNVAHYLSEEELDFLSSVSVCRRFNRALCELLSGSPRTAELLRKFEAEQLFLLPIDTPEIEPWYRFHRLFESFLRMRLERRDKAELRALYQRAARWFADQRLAIEALRYASEAGDHEMMVELIDRSARRLAREGYFRQLLKWCAQVPKELLGDRLNISLNLAWAQLSCGYLDAFQDNMGAILRHPKHTSASVHYEVQLLQAYGCAARDDSAGVVGNVEPFLKDPLPGDVFLLSLLGALASTGFVYAGRYPEAREAIRIFYKHLPPNQPQHEHLLADMAIGYSYLVEGRIRDALAYLIPFKENILLRGKVGPDALANMIGTLCEALYQFNQLDDARALIETYSEIIDTAELPDGILFGYRVRAHLDLLAGNSKGAFEHIQRLEEIGTQRKLDRLVAWSLYEQLQLSMHSHHLTARDEILQRLARLAKKYAHFKACSWAEIPLIASMASAEVAFYREPASADCLAAIDIAENHCKALGRSAAMVRLGFMRCIGALESGRQTQALNEAAELLALASRLGTKRVLADIGPAAQRLAKMLVARVQPDIARELLDAALREDMGSTALDGRTQPDALGVIAEPLTMREQEVLELLGKGLSAKSISRSLDISITTAKWHLKNVYAKLGAGSREDALNKARRYNIIS